MIGLLVLALTSQQLGPKPPGEAGMAYAQCIERQVNILAQQPAATDVVAEAVLKACSGERPAADVEGGALPSKTDVMEQVDQVRHRGDNPPPPGN